MTQVRRISLPVIRPKTVGDCRRSVRPCPWFGCKFNLLIDVLEDGGIVINARYRGSAPIGETRPDGAERVIPAKPEFEERFLDEIEDAIEVWFDEPIPPVKSCVLDESMHRFKDDHQLDEIADVMFVSRERVRQIEASGLRKLRVACREAGISLRDFLQELARTRDE